MEENQPQPQSQQEKKAPKVIEQIIFNALLNRLLFNTGFYVATALKEKPRFEGDFTVYHVNVIINNSVIDANSELMMVLNANCNAVQISNDARFPNQILIVAEIYVAPTPTPVPAATAEKVG
jgi:ribonucleotide reductase beta subunit family protein with ferritin-like domain